MALGDEKQIRFAIPGTTGMFGGYALRYMLNLPSVGRVTTIVRREFGVSDAKLKKVLIRDFSNCSKVAQELSGQNAAVFCLGAYTETVSDDELRRVTVDYTVDFARVFRAASPDAAFSFLSGAGANGNTRPKWSVW